MTHRPKDPAILSDPMAQAWRRGELSDGEVLTPQPMTPNDDLRERAEAEQIDRDRVFCATVWEALMDDHNDLRREAIILRAHRAAIEALQQRVERLEAEKDFLLLRAGKAGKASFGGERWTGMSSNALVTIAFGGEDDCLPSDGSDLAACYRTMQRLPKHLLSKRLFEQLAKGERAVRKECVSWARQSTQWDDNIARGDVG